jgi:hypothetical protein
MRPKAPPDVSDCHLNKHRLINSLGAFVHETRLGHESPQVVLPPKIFPKLPESRKNKTRRALWEYDNIIRSLYLLDYIDSPPLRRHVQRAMNRSESYHQLRRAVSYANYGKLRFKTEYEQQLWEECSRLVTNCIIYYNATILSSLLSYKERTGDSQGAALLKQVSPVAWQHINLHGAPGSARKESSYEGTLLGVNSVARGTGALTRGRRVSEAPSTMWLKDGLQSQELLARIRLWLRKKLSFDAPYDGPPAEVG